MLRRSSVRLAMLRRPAVLWPIVLCVLLVPFCSALDYEETHDEAREFLAGGMLHVHLSVGDVRIMRSDTNKITLHYTVKSRRENNVKDAQVNFQVKGRDARIEFQASSGGNTQFEVEIEVPQNTNLDVHEKVGDITVEEIEGDKDLELGVGNIRVRASHSAYRQVNASTSIGDVNGTDYGATSGWLGKTLKYHGDGKYELRAHVGVGDITLEGK